MGSGVVQGCKFLEGTDTSVFKRNNGRKIFAALATEGRERGEGVYHYTINRRSKGKLAVDGLWTRASQQATALALWPVNEKKNNNK